MGSFAADAEHLLEIGRTPSDPEFGYSEVAILIDRDGGIRVIDATGWSVEALRAETGARTVYRLARRAGRVSIEGCSGLKRLQLAAFSREDPPKSGNCGTRIAKCGRPSPAPRSVLPLLPGPA